MLKKIITLFVIFLLSYSYVFSADTSNKNIFQEWLDKHFKEIDKGIETYLTNLNKQKNHCFWKERKQNFIECINDIEKNFENYSNSYNNACTEILADVLDKQEDKSVSSIEATNFIEDRDSNLCKDLYSLKIRISKQVAYDILKRNKYQILKDENKIFTQEQRKKYWELLNLIRVNIWYIERLWKKWPSKTRK
jgi:hypothetical protein